MNKVGLWNGFSFITKIFIGIFLLFIIIITCLTAFMAASPATNTTVQQSNAQSDLDKFSNYHKQLVAIEKPLDDANADYQHKSKEALNEGNLYALYDSAKNLHDASMEAIYSLSQITPPSLDNVAAQQSLEAIGDAFGSYIGSLRDLSSNVMDMANSGNLSPKSVNNVQEDAKMYQSASIDLAVNILKAYNALGINDVDQIDLENGGLAPKKSSNPRS